MLYYWLIFCAGSCLKGRNKMKQKYCVIFYFVNMTHYMPIKICNHLFNAFYIMILIIYCIINNIMLYL
jgi:predicted permease